MSEHVPVMSKLCQEITENDQTVQIDIYANGEGGWILEAIDEFNNSTVWDDPFSSEEAALSEALRTIREEGIQSLIGPQNTRTH
jgi:hypothetical protein